MDPSLKPVPFPVHTSLRYHNLHPDYIHERLQSLGKTFALRVLLVQVDVVSKCLGWHHPLHAVGAQSLEFTAKSF